MPARTKTTVRMPVELLAKVRQVKPDDESLNDFVVKAVDQEIRRRGLKTFAEILELKEEIYRQFGRHPDSTPYIRALRDGTEPHV